MDSPRFAKLPPQEFSVALTAFDVSELGHLTIRDAAVSRHARSVLGFTPAEERSIILRIQSGPVVTLNAADFTFNEVGYLVVTNRRIVDQMKPSLAGSRSDSEFRFIVDPVAYPGEEWLWGEDSDTPGLHMRRLSASDFTVNDHGELLITLPNVHDTKQS